MLILVPITLSDAYVLVSGLHRHHKPPQGGLFAVACALDGADEPCGCAIVGRPVARMLNDGWTLEVTRCCVAEGHPGAASMLYAAAWRASKALGYKRLVTYTLQREAGASLRAAGWKCLGNAGGRSWHRESRPRVDKAPTEQKTLWEAA